MLMKMIKTKELKLYMEDTPEFKKEIKEGLIGIDNGELILIYNSTVSAKGIELNRKGDSVFVDKGSELKIG